MTPGDSIVVHFKVGGPNAINRLPEVKATILANEGDALRVRYADDAELFAGLIGLIRLPREYRKGGKRGRPRTTKEPPA